MGCHFLLQGIFLTRGSLESLESALAGALFPTVPSGKPRSLSTHTLWSPDVRGEGWVLECDSVSFVSVTTAAMVHVQQHCCYGSHGWGVGALLISGGTAPNTADLLSTITGTELEALRSRHTQASAHTAAKCGSEKSPVLPAFRRPVGALSFREL